MTLVEFESSDNKWKTLKAFPIRQARYPRCPRCGGRDILIRHVKLRNAYYNGVRGRASITTHLCRTCYEPFVPKSFKLRVVKGVK